MSQEPQQEKSLGFPQESNETLWQSVSYRIG